MKTPQNLKRLAACLACACVICACALAGCGQSEQTASAQGQAASAQGQAASTQGQAASTQETSSAADAADQAASNASTAALEPTNRATLTVEGYDPISIDLYASEAPETVANFCKLASEGYYDGLTFYRFVDGFCMQGGTKGNSASSTDPNLDSIVGEFSANGHENALADHFEKGVVAMARTSDPDSAKSTFFVTLDSSEGVSMSLDGQYAAFGRIDEAGMQVVDEIVADYLPSVSDPQSGAIGDESSQARIASLTVDN